MKNFYDLQDIKKQINISLTIVPVIDIQMPNVKIEVNNNILYNGNLENKLILKHQINLLETTDIKLELLNKDYNCSKNTAITIESVKINSFELIPRWTQLATYKNDQNVAQPTNYMGFNGIWNLKIDEPFYRWQHKITGQGWLLEP
jgi:type II secretory pathway component HofQ